MIKESITLLLQRLMDEKLFFWTRHFLKGNTCSLPVHSKCTILSAMEIKFLGMINYPLIYFCDFSCYQGLKELQKLKALIKILRKFHVEVESLNTSHT